MAIAENKKRVQVTLAKETLKRLDHYASQTPFKKSDIIELALLDYFEQKVLQGS